MPNFNITAEFDLTTHVEPEGIRIDHPDGVAEFEDTSYFGGDDVTANGGSIAFTLEDLGDEDEAERKAEEVVYDGMEYTDDNGLTWVTDNVSISIEEIEVEMDKARAVSIIESFLDYELQSGRIDAEQKEAFEFMLAYVSGDDDVTELYDQAAPERRTEDRQRYRVAMHEAAHAVAAKVMGLTVAWVQIDPGHDEGINFDAAVKIPDETLDRVRDVKAVCVSMAAPSFIVSHTGHRIGEYAQIEARVAYGVADESGLDSGEVYDLAAEIVDEHWQDILLLADRLAEEGRVEF